MTVATATKPHPIYLAGRWGARIEDIVVATESGPEALNTVSHDLAVVEA